VSLQNDNRGFALVLTLVVAALLIALVTEFITEVYVDTTSRQSYVDAQKAGLLAESGIAGAIGLLRFTNSGAGYTSLKDPWAKPLEIPDDLGLLRITIEDETAKLSLNHFAGTNGTFIDETDPTGSYYGTAMRLFRRLKLPAADLCDAVADWQDDNDIPKPGGAETPWYSSRKPAFPAKNARLDTFEELALVKGFSCDTLERIRPFTTVYAENSVAAPVNINTASREILLALDERIGEALADQIIAYRKNTPFKDKADLARVPGMERIATGLQSRITAKSNIFSIRAEAQVNGTTRVVECVVNFAGAAPQTLYWREY
jgi:general secretion pathway protein K